MAIIFIHWTKLYPYQIRLDRVSCPVDNFWTTTFIQWTEVVQDKSYLFPWMALSIVLNNRALVSLTFVLNIGYVELYTKVLTNELFFRHVITAFILNMPVVQIVSHRLWAWYFKILWIVKRVCCIGECPSNSPFLKNNGAEAHCF